MLNRTGFDLMRWLGLQIALPVLPLFAVILIASIRQTDVSWSDLIKVIGTGEVLFMGIALLINALNSAVDTVIAGKVDLKLFTGCMVAMILILLECMAYADVMFRRVQPQNGAVNEALTPAFIMLAVSSVLGILMHRRALQILG